MDKPIDGLAGAMREIAEQRDSRLRDAKAIPADRLEQLQAFLAAALPVETALLAAARRRDASLSPTEPSLPPAVNFVLMEQVSAVRVPGRPVDIFWSLAARFQRSNFAVVTRIAAVAALIIALMWMGVRFSSSRRPAAQISEGSSPAFNVNLLPAAFLNGDAFQRSANDLTLRVSRIELASLDASLLTSTHALPDVAVPDRGVLLDLPLKHIRLDVDALRTP